MTPGFSERRYFRARNARRRARTAGGTFLERKEERRAYRMAFAHGWRRRPCVACGGSGHYDNDGSPPCAGCDGTGWEAYPGPKARNDRTG